MGHLYTGCLTIVGTIFVDSYRLN